MDERVGFDIGHSAAAVVPRRLRLRVRGLVQGVGFRPHVWRLATRNDLTGFALNDQDGVLIEVQGAVDAFVGDLVAQAPPLARIDDVESELCALVAGRDAISSSATASSTARRAPRSRPMSRFARPASPSCSIRRTAATSIRSSPARIAGRASP